MVIYYKVIGVKGQEGNNTMLNSSMIWLGKQVYAKDMWQTKKTLRAKTGRKKKAFDEGSTQGGIENDLLEEVGGKMRITWNYQKGVSLLYNILFYF